MTAPRRNRTALALGLLLVVVGALTFGVLYASAGDRHAVLVVRRPVRAGAALVDADLGEAQVSIDGDVRPIPASLRRSIVGRTAGVQLAEGELLVQSQLSSSPVIPEGFAVVGLALRAGQLPPHLRPADRVQLVTTGAVDGSPGAASGRVVVADARVLSAEVTDNGVTVGVIVSVRDAPQIVALAAAGQVGVLLVGGAG